MFALFSFQNRRKRTYLCSTVHPVFLGDVSPFGVSVCMCGDECVWSFSEGDVGCVMGGDRTSYVFVSVTVFL